MNTKVGSLPSTAQIENFPYPSPDDIAAKSRHTVSNSKPQAYQAPRGANNTAQTKTLQDAKRDEAAMIRKEKMAAYGKEFEASGTYEKVHAQIQKDHPGIGAPDGTPIGVKLSMAGSTIDPGKLLPGTILFSYEPFGQPLTFTTRSRTVDGQAKDHNGIPASCNQGDPRNVHNAIVIGHDSAGKVLVAEARGGRLEAPWLAEGDVNRVQITVLNPTLHHHCKAVVPTDDTHREAIAMIATSLAEGHSVGYGYADLSSGLRGDHEFGAKASEGAVALGLDAFERIPDWSLNASNTAKGKLKGVTCISFVTKVDQAAQLRISYEVEMEDACFKHFESLPENEKAGVLEQAQGIVSENERKTEKALREKHENLPENELAVLIANAKLTEGERQTEIKEKIVNLMRDALPADKRPTLAGQIGKLRGLGACDPGNVSVRTGEHITITATYPDDTPMYKSVGKFEITEKDRGPKEAEAPPLPFVLPALPPTDPNSMEYQEAQEAQKKAEQEAQKKLKANL